MKKLLLITSLFLLTLSACIKKGDLSLSNAQLSNWMPDWALPILNSDLTLANLVKPSDYISTDGTGLYSLHYSGKIFTAKASDYIKIPDQNFSTAPFTLTTPISVPSFTGSLSDSFSSSYSYTDTNGSRLQHINFKSGMLTINLTSTFQQNMSISVSLPGLTKFGVPVVLTTTITYPSTTASVTLDLSNCILDMTNGGTAQNYIAYKIRYTITGSGQPIATTNTLAATLGMNNLQYSFIDGYLGRYSIPINQDTIGINIFNNTLHANIFLENPKINLHFVNSFGLGVSTAFDSLYGLTNAGVFVHTSIPGIALPGAASPSSPSSYNYTIDKTNSTIQNIFNPAPDRIIYKGHITINSTLASGYSFLSDTSSITMTADAELPAYFKIIDFSLQDTAKLLFPKDTDILKQVEFKMLVNNGFPIYGSVQLYFADSNYNVMDSLIQSTADMIGQAPVDASGNVTGTTTAISTFVMDQTRYTHMAARVRYVFTRGKLKSSGSNSVQIHNTDHIQIKLGFRFTLNPSTTQF